MGITAAPGGGFRPPWERRNAMDRNDVLDQDPFSTVPSRTQVIDLLKSGHGQISRKRSRIVYFTASLEAASGVPS